MEIALTLAAVLGGLLFIFSYLKFALTGFRYHPVTGFLALIPVVNLITLPTLLDSKLIRIILFGIFGLVLSVGAWFLGADKSLQRHIATLRGQPVLVSTADQKNSNEDNNLSSTNASAQGRTDGQDKDSKGVASSTDSVIQAHPVYLENLPKQALYSMAFVDAPVEQINTLKGRVVRIVTSKNTVVEGRVQNTTTASVFISRQGGENIAYEMLVSNIKQLQVLVKR
ncbi:MAG: hypothetical protein KAH03_04460 [Cocleimonas sp.]|nr:hypothetical protein [Cocleimonas sp.]